MPFFNRVWSHGYSRCSLADTCCFHDVTLNDAFSEHVGHILKMLPLNFDVLWNCLLNSLQTFYESDFFHSKKYFVERFSSSIAYFFISTFNYSWSRKPKVFSSPLYFPPSLKFNQLIINYSYTAACVFIYFAMFMRKTSTRSWGC